MKQIIYITLLICCTAFISCKEAEYDWKPVKLEWKSVSYKSQKIGESDYYMVPKEGGVYTFVCTNWLPTSHYQYNMYDINNSLGGSDNTYTDVSTKYNTATITISPNDTITRYSFVCFDDIGAYGKLQFVQEGTK